MVDKNTILSVRAYFVTCLQQGWNGTTFDNVLLHRTFDICQDLIDFLDVINGNQLVRWRQCAVCDRDIWESNALESILKEAKKLKILKKVRRDKNEVYRYDLIKELIEKMKTNRLYCMIVCDFLANSKLSNVPERYYNLCILCRYCVDCKKALESNFRVERQLL